MASVDSRDEGAARPLNMPGRHELPAFQAGHHWVSPFNFADGVREVCDFPSPLKIYDSTLRKILLTPGVSPPISELLKIAEKLEAVGVREIVLNIHWWGDPAPNSRELALCREILSRGFAFHTTVYVEAALPGPVNVVTPQQALTMVRDLGAESVELPSFHSPANADEWARNIDEFRDACEFAQSIGLATVLGISDAGRADLEYTAQLANEAISAGCKRISLLDSYSSLSCDAMKLFCSTFRRRLQRPVELSMHVHNDFGLGSALAVAAATAGVNPDVSVNSVSYRSGFAAMQEVVTTLELLYDQRTGITLSELSEISALVASAVDVPERAFAPLTGKHQFLRDDPEGMLDHMRDGPGTFPIASSCVAPAVIGASTEIVWGDRHATSTIRAKLAQMGLPISDALVELLYRRVVDEVQSRSEYPRWLGEQEVEDLCREVASG